jgi:hypothetical protein
MARLSYFSCWIVISLQIVNMIDKLYLFDYVHIFTLLFMLMCCDIGCIYICIDYVSICLQLWKLM